MGLSRKSFLGTLAAACGTVAGLPALIRARKHNPSKEWMGMLTDLSLCIGCRQCEWACNEANGLPNVPLEFLNDPEIFDTRRRTTATQYTVVNRFDAEQSAKPVYVKRQCMHCIEPACASACLVKAFTKTSSGPVVYNPDVCIGCRYCMVACPFNVPAYEYDDPFAPEVKKCTMCFEQYAQGGKAPACASSCPCEAILFGRRSELIKIARQRIHDHPDQYIDHIYGEHEVGGTCWLYLSPVPFEELGFRTDLGDIPYPERTKSFLSAVPLVLTIWPMLLMGTYAFSHNHKDSPEAHEQNQEEAAS